MLLAMAAASPNIHVANPLAMLAVLVSVLFAGFFVPESAIPRALRPL